MKNAESRPSSLVVLFMLLAGSLAAQAPATTKTPASISNQNSQVASGGPTLPNLPVPAAAGKPHDNSFVIGNDDVLAINVWKEPEISRSLPVRSDGRISLPLVGELQAAGRTPLQLEQEIASRLQSFMTDPEVTVIVQEINSQQFNILGQVLKPGAYSLTRRTTVLDAIAIAGGFKDFAKQKSVYILRQYPNGGEFRIPFNYKEVIKGRNPAQNILLQPNDTVVVP